MNEQVRRPVERDPLVAALLGTSRPSTAAIPDGPDQLRNHLASGPDSANVIAMDAKREVGAA